MLKRCPVQSFVRREGRITRGQKNALKRLWGRYGIDLVAAQKLDFDKLFRRTAPVWLEIGFGDGEGCIAMAKRNPETNFLGIEVYRPGVGHLLIQAAEQELSNIRVICEDAVAVLGQHCEGQCFERVMLFFPDPWPKKRHQKRRIVQPGFVNLIYHKLKSKGILHMATDWEDYAHQMLIVMSSAQGFANLAGASQFAVQPFYRPVTKFERRGVGLGHRVWDLVFQKR